MLYTSYFKLIKIFRKLIFEDYLTPISMHSQPLFEIFLDNLD